MARMRQKSIVSAGASARAVSSAKARERSPSSRCANASATANSARMMVMSATWAARRTPAATRRASSGRPASASPNARVPSNAKRRSGSRLKATSACRTSSEVSSQRSDNASSRATPLAANRPSGSCQQDVPEIEHHLSIQRSALDPASTDDRRRSPQHVRPECGSVSLGRDLSTHHVNCSTSSTNRRRSTRRWHHAYSTIDSRSLTATAAGIAAIVRWTVASRPLS